MIDLGCGIVTHGSGNAAVSRFGVIQEGFELVAGGGAIKVTGGNDGISILRFLIERK